MFMGFSEARVNSIDLHKVGEGDVSCFVWAGICCFPEWDALV